MATRRNKEIFFNSNFLYLRDLISLSLSNYPILAFSKIQRPSVAIRKRFKKQAALLEYAPFTTMSNKAPGSKPLALPILARANPVTESENTDILKEEIVNSSAIQENMQNEHQTPIDNGLASATIDREDYTHPEKIYKGLIFSPTPDKRNASKDEGLGATRVKGESFYYKGDPREEELCWSCGWNVYHELTASYGSRIRILHTHGCIGIWEIGSRWLIRDQPNDHTMGNDFMTQEFLRNQPNLDIPIVKEMRILSAPTDKVVLTLMSRAQGVGLDTIWDSLSPQQRSNYQGQLGNAIKQWRQFTSPVIGKVDGDLLDDTLIGYCLHRVAPTCHKIGRTTEEWFKNLEADLRFGLSILHKTHDRLVIDEKFEELKRNFPKSEPYVLTHTDLNLTNIIVKDDKIQAIIDWEFAGYLPWWAERWSSLLNGNPQSDQLFDPLWDDLHEGMDRDTFQKEIIEKVSPVVNAWNQTRHRIEHPDYFTEWFRPPFCECKPYAGVFRWNKIGHTIQHVTQEVVYEE